MRLVITGIFAAVMMMQQPAVAAPNDYEIDLRELRRPAPHRPAKAEAGKPAEPGQESFYVVKPGEHLFQILMKKYGLSDPEAERLIPKVMQLNGISSPKGLKVGQRLRIPLSATEGPHRASLPAPTPAPLSPPAATTTSQPALAQVTTQASLPQPAAPPLAAEIISIISESPCKLARNLEKKMGLTATSPPTISGVETAAATHAGQNVTAVCGLSEAERYTYERLLASSGTQLLFFDGDESADNVVEELADSLGLEYQKRATQPLKYIFQPFGTRTQELHLTIFPSGEPQ